MTFFRLSRSEIPRAVIHDTEKELIFIQQPEGEPPRHGAGDPPSLTEASIETFLAESLGLALPTVMHDSRDVTKVVNIENDAMINSAEEVDIDPSNGVETIYSSSDIENIISSMNSNKDRNSRVEF